MQQTKAKGRNYQQPESPPSSVEELEAELVPKSYIKKYLDWLKQALVLFKERKFVFSALLLITWALLTFTVFAGMDVIRILIYFFKLYVI